MTTFYFVRHGKVDFSEINHKIYQGVGHNAITLSEIGKEQIRNTAKDERLKDAELIITSPFGRTMHSAAILSKELNLDIQVETNLHEWQASKDFSWLSDEEAGKCYTELNENNGYYPPGEIRGYETADDIKKRVDEVLDKYKDNKKVIVVCHGTLMQYYFGTSHPENGEIFVLER